jgi:hypothetical protein
MRHRDPPAPKALCLHFGWSGTPPHTLLRDDRGDASLILSVKRCPRCDRELTQLREKQPPIVVQIVTAIREADLTADELLRLADVVREATNDTSPRDLAAKAPGASNIIAILPRAPARTGSRCSRWSSPRSPSM